MNDEAGVKFLSGLHGLADANPEAVELANAYGPYSHGTWASQELELYSPLVTPGSYIVAHDGAQAWVSDIPNGKPEWKDDHPLGAIHKFLASHPEFFNDPHWTRWGITSSPDGFLKRA